MNLLAICLDIQIFMFPLWLEHEYFHITMFNFVLEFSGCVCVCMHWFSIEYGGEGWRQCIFTFWHKRWIVIHVYGANDDGQWKPQENISNNRVYAKEMINGENIESRLFTLNSMNAWEMHEQQVSINLIECPVGEQRKEALIKRKTKASHYHAIKNATAT